MVFLAFSAGCPFLLRHNDKRIKEILSVYIAFSVHRLKVVFSHISHRTEKSLFGF